MKKNYYIELLEKYLRDEASLLEMEELQAYLTSNKKIDSFFEEKLANSHSVIDEQVEKRMFQNIYKEIGDKKPKLIFPINKNKILQWAAIFLLPIITALAVIYITQNSNVNFHPVTITAQKGEKAEVVLPDGTKVWINSESTIPTTIVIIKKTV